MRLDRRTARWLLPWTAFALGTTCICGPAWSQQKEFLDDSAAGPPAIAVLTFDCNLDEPEDAGQMLGEILSARLAADGSFAIVERQAIETILNEHKLTLSGLISSDEAATLGKLTGTELLVTGRVTVSGDHLYIVSKVISVETGQLKGFFLSLSRETAFPELVDRLGDKLAFSLREWAGPLTERKQAPLRLNEVLKAMLATKDLPAVAVLVSEEHLGRPILDPAVETELKHLLTEAGVEVRTIPREVAQEIASGVEDYPRLARRLEGVKYLIIGEAISESGASIYGMSVAIARAELQIIDLDQGRVVVADRTTARAPDLSDHLAAKTALQKAGNDLARRMLPRWIETLEDKAQP